MASSNDPINQAFESAIRDFKADLDDDKLFADILKVHSIEEVYDATDKIQEERRNGKLCHLAKMEPFLDRLREYAGVIEVFTQAKPDILALIWGPIKLVLQWANNVTQSLEALINISSEIGAVLPEFIGMSKLFKDNTCLNDVLVLFFRDILDFHLVTIRFFRLKCERLSFAH